MILLVSLLAAVLALPAPSGAVVTVSSQEALDSLDLAAVLPEAGDVTLSFSPGTYTFRDGMLSLAGISRPDLSVHIEGNGACFVADGPVYRMEPDGTSFSASCEEPFDIGDGFLRGDGMENLDLRTPVKTCRFFPIPIHPGKGIFCIPTGEPDLPEAEAEDVHVLITQWYIGAVFKVKKIKNGWIHYYNDPQVETPFYSELRFGRCLPRYALYNLPRRVDPAIHGGRIRSGDGTWIRRCKASSFLSVDSCRFASITLTDCRFRGNREGAPLISFRSTESDSLCIEHCVFEAIRGDILSILDTDHVRFRRNEVKQAYLRAVLSDWFSADTRVEDNRFIGQGRRISNHPCVHCKGPGFSIQRNLFEDCAYIAIGAGTHFTETDGAYASGVIRWNEIYQTDRFLQEDRFYLTDSGAIYLWTQNRSVEIADNCIHHIGGSHGNRGILPDDGPSHLWIHDNLVFDILNHRCVDLRKDRTPLRHKLSLAHEVNMDNRLTDNIFGGKVHFYIRKDDPSSSVEGNVFTDDPARLQAAYADWCRRRALQSE